MCARLATKFKMAVSYWSTAYCKEYVLVIEGSVPPFVVHRKHFPPPLSAGFVGSYTDGQVVEDTADRAERVLPMDNEGGD